MLTSILMAIRMIAMQQTETAGSGGGSEPIADENIVVTNGKPRPNTDTRAARKKPVERDPKPYGVPLFSRPATSSVSPEKKGRGKSTMAIRVQVPIPSLGWVADCAIWAVVVNRADGRGVKPEVGFPSRVGFETDTDAKRWTAHIATAAIKWDGYDAAMEAAEERLMSEEKPVRAGAQSVEDGDLPVRLVKKSASR